MQVGLLLLSDCHTHPKLSSRQPFPRGQPCDWSSATNSDRALGVVWDLPQSPSPGQGLISESTGLLCDSLWLCCPGVSPNPSYLLRSSDHSTPQRPSSGALPILCDRDCVQPAERALCSPIPQGNLLWSHLNPEVHLSVSNAQFAKVSLSGLRVGAVSLVTDDLPINCEACQRHGQ